MKYEPQKAEDCEEIERHTACPVGYLQWHDWAEQMYNKGWRQRRCPCCGFYAVWLKPTRGVSNNK